MSVNDEDEEICGESFDHDPVVVDERDGERALWCRNCGAEWTEASE